MAMNELARIELWFIRHGESKNNEILNRARGLGAITYPIEFTQDPTLTRKGALVAAENGQRLVDCNISFDLCLTSSLCRTMETAFFMLVKSGLCTTDKVYVVPHVSEIPLRAGPIPIYENMPLRRGKQIEKLGKAHGGEILDAISWDFVGGPEGDNEATLPPNGQKFYDFLFHLPLVQELVKTPGRERVRIAIVTHSLFLKQLLELESKPANADIWVAELYVSHCSLGEDATEQFLSLSRAVPWFQEHIANKREALAKRITRIKTRTERKMFKYETKIFKLKHGLEEEEVVPASIQRKESRLSQRLERRRKRYERKLAKLQAKLANATNQSDRDLMAQQLQEEEQEEEEEEDFASSEDSEEE